MLLKLCYVEDDSAQTRGNTDASVEIPEVERHLLFRHRGRSYQI